MSTKNQEYSEASLDTEGAAAHFAAKMAFTTGPTELQRAIDNDEVVVVDVRLAEHYAEGHIPKSISLPQAEWGPAKASRGRSRTFSSATTSPATWPRRLRWNSPETAIRCWSSRAE